MTRERFEYLLQQYLLQQLTEEELNEFFEAASLPEFEPVIKAALDRDLQSPTIAGSTVAGQAQQSYENFARLISDPGSDIPEDNRRPVIRLAWWRYAAVFVLLAGAVAWLWLKKAPDQPGSELVSLQTHSIDIAPGTNRATLTLADGTSILLDSTHTGTLAMQGNARIEKAADGEVVYNVQGSNAGTIMMNTMSTPRGGQYRLTLPDGSKVWLNAASSITYPTAFTGKDREVAVTGEAYFEVARNTAHPFIVKKGAASVMVLGTHFNVNAYDDEASLKVTLLEGSVKVMNQPASGDLQSAVLKPGEQAVLTRDARQADSTVVKAALLVNNNADVAAAVAWKNGIFNFHKASLQEVMRQLSRWYDVEVIYQKGIPHMEFGGEMGRDLTLSQVLQGFADMEVHFRIEDGKRLIVMP
jgi:Fe2+-dicitrate sensor, membrane component